MKSSRSAMIVASALMLGGSMAAFAACYDPKSSTIAAGGTCSINFFGFASCTNDTPSQAASGGCPTGTSTSDCASTQQALYYNYTPAVQWAKTCASGCVVDGGPAGAVYYGKSDGTECGA